ncbi:MAG: hypothetical protein JWQ93_2799 [Marmoricola sp.]|nr:hypothetical protein [Marmoricola sp.]
MRNPRKHLLLISLLVMVAAALAAPFSPASAATSNALSNGCTHTERGLPSCGAYVGGAYGSNSDVAPWEKSMGKTLGIHRSYYSAAKVDSAVKKAKADVANHRVPWISFKTPYSWGDMAKGKGDAWAKDIAVRMKAVGGPVWIAIHHEPEGDGDIQQWKAMQTRLAPIMRAAAPNLAYTIILMGYHEFHGDKKYAMSAIWPNTKIDVAGFDIYEKYGSQGVTTWKDFDNDYFAPIQAWAKSKGVAWGLSETGFSDKAAAKDPKWMLKTYTSMKAHGGIAWSYFNTTLNSVSNWSLSNATKKNAFTEINKDAPILK